MRELGRGEAAGPRGDEQQHQQQVAQAAAHAAQAGSSTVATACAAMPSPRPVKPSRSVVVALTEMRPGVHAQQLGQPRDHRRRVRGDLGPLADQRHVGVGQHAAPRRDPRGGVAQEARAVGVLPLGLAGREVAADVALRQRAVDRVAQRVDAHVGVRMPGQAPVVRHGDAAQHQRAPGLPGVDVEPGAGARQQPGQQGAFQPHEILRIGELDVVLAPGTIATGWPASSSRAASSVAPPSPVACSARSRW